MLYELEKCALVQLVSTMARKIKVLKQEKTILALTSQNGIFSDFRALGTLPSLDFSVVVRQGFRQNTNRDKLDFLKKVSSICFHNFFTTTHQETNIEKSRKS